MSIINELRKATATAVLELFGKPIAAQDIALNTTKPDFEGDYTIVLFAWVKEFKQSPDAIGNALGEHLVASRPELIEGFNIVKGFLNLSIASAYWTDFLFQNYDNPAFGQAPPSGRKVVVEYSSPNTNKPLHLGHLRNNFLGWSMAAILKSCGHDVVKTSIVNDRGVHICKSMLAWKLFSNGETPESSSKKGDHLVGDYYVMFENALKAEAAPLLEKLLTGDYSECQPSDIPKAKAFIEKLEASDLTPDKKGALKAELLEIARNNTNMMQQVRQMLQLWEAGDTATIDLWKRMNSWVYAGFDVTYKNIGSDFQKVFYESDTYLLGKQYVEEGLKKEIFFKKEDGSVWIDLTADGLDEKLVLRKDGTSVYMTQDLGLAKLKYEAFAMDDSIYVIGDEQNYHMKVLKLICQRLGLPNADGISHLSYGMVELPTGKMKSREGTVVDADDMVATMQNIAGQHTVALGKVKDFTDAELLILYNTIGLGALKFFLLRVDAKKRIIFNPEESIDFHGFTGPFVQYTHARIKSILRKGLPQAINTTGELFPLEKELLIHLEQFPLTIQQAGEEQNPSVIANYVFTLAKTFNSLYAEHSIANAESSVKKELRLQLAAMTSNVIKYAMGILGINVPERM